MSKDARNTGSSSTETGNDDPPQLNVDIPTKKDVTTRKKQPNLPVDVLLLTVNDCEFLACYSQLENPYRCCFENLGYVYFADVVESQEEKVKVALMRCYPGSAGPGGSIITVKNASTVLRPKAVISVGTCSGLNPDKTKLGDVVVSAKLATYASKLVTSDQEQSTGFRTIASRRFHKIIQNCADGWHPPLKNPKDREIEVHCDGEFLSGPEQVSAEWRRKQLAGLNPLATTLEMEGEGIFTAAHDNQIEWLIVKSIADYADGAEVTTKCWAPCASVMAASLVAHILSDPGVFCEWPHYADPSSDAQRSTQLNPGMKRKLDEHHEAGTSSDGQNSTQAKSAKFSSSQASQRTEDMTEHHSDVPYPTHIIERIRQLYKCREGHILPFPWCDDFSFNLKDIFTRLKIVSKEKTRGALTDEITNITAIFKPHAKCQNPRIVLIEGEPGMGKTTYSQKLAYDWATNQDEWDESFPAIEVLIFLRCHDIKSSIWDAIDDQILPKDVDAEGKKHFVKFIQENQSKVLLMLDGLDEADPSKLSAIYLKLLESKEFPYCHIVITSRHEVGKKVRRYSDTLWEIQGFTQLHAQTFITKYFHNMEHLARKLIRKLWPYNYDNDDDDDDDDDDAQKLRELTKNPLNTALLCVLFEDLKGVLPTNRTQLYVKIVLCVLQRYEKKNEILNNNEDLISEYKTELLLLGRLALDALRNGEFHFDKEDSFRFTVLIKFGFLSVQSGGTKWKPCIRCAFLHKSFQEFFAGFYLAIQLMDNVIDCASVVNDERYLHELKEVFSFVTGIIASQSEETALSLVNSITAHINLLLRTPDSKAASYMTLAFNFISQCSTLKKNLDSQLVRTVGENLDLSPLNDLNLINASIGDVGASCLSQAFTANSSLTNLYLGVNGIGAEGASFLSKALTANSSLTYLDLGSNSIGAEGASFLSKALTANSSLTNLNLGHNSIGAEGASFLSKALTANSSLTNLVLYDNSIGDEGASILSKALTANSSLTNLCLGSNSIGAEGASFLSKALTANSSLTNLVLYDNSIGDEGASFLSKALTANSSLTYLDLGSNSIGAEGASFLFKALTANSSLTNLVLSGNRIGAEGASFLSNALAANSSLTYLVLSGNSIGAEGASFLSNALAANSSLTYLVLSDNSIGAEGASFLSKALTANSSLTNLVLSGNSIGAEGASFLSKTLAANSSLTELDLSDNGIDAEGASFLSKALTANSSLTSLYLRYNSIGAEGASFLSKTLAANSSLTELDLSNNGIGAEGASFLSKALTANSSLTSLYLSYNSIGAEGASFLSKALTANSSLTFLNLIFNSIGAEGAKFLSEARKVNKAVNVVW